jgi:hypothetical protein
MHGITIPIHIDIGGNVYFEYDNVLHQLNIDHNNAPYFIRDRFPEIPVNPCTPSCIGKLQLDSTFVQNYYYPEDGGHTCIGDHEYEQDQYDEIYFAFFENGLHFDIKNRCLESNDVDYTTSEAAYDTLIYDSKNSLVFRTKLVGDVCVYRVSLYLDGKITVRIMCDRIINTYQLVIKTHLECQKI